MWGAQAEKSCFPYELFNDISELENTVTWPGIAAFKSSLSKTKFTYNEIELRDFYTLVMNEINCNEDTYFRMLKLSNRVESFSHLSEQEYPTCLKTYIKSWIYYVKQYDAGLMTSMKDYLIYYNCIDTEVLCDGFQNYVDSFIRNFQISPVGYLTLPGLSEKVMWKQYDKTEASPYSFSNKFGHINEIIRGSLIGGLSTVFKRHVEIGESDEQFADCVHRARNGLRFNRLVAYDANSKLLITLYFLPL